NELVVSPAEFASNGKRYVGTTFTAANTAHVIDLGYEVRNGVNQQLTSTAPVESINPMLRIEQLLQRIPVLLSSNNTGDQWQDIPLVSVGSIDGKFELWPSQPYAAGKFDLLVKESEKLDQPSDEELGLAILRAFDRCQPRED